MKKWEQAQLEELKIEETAHRLFGSYRDGGYIGDGLISGHNTTVKPSDPDPDLNQNS